MQAQVLSAADARCDASRSMRASAVLILRDARTLVRMLRDCCGTRAPQDEDGISACRIAARR